MVIPSGIPDLLLPETHGKPGGVPPLPLVVNIRSKATLFRRTG